ncbi:hypothetical protein sscle_10g078630 [Sclerotinia sclerotiorum 1980 UF-70]|uniref:Major facilitator superfamily (MFS) profile domain-containing protein n=1 Tax=Sclerotinia sclerotiorum (strain ATCC 18683 / 1980 / Ss-1) TaxID=665079 RepID=A0A1D9QEQ3_SCLS1|nr:hypothetical protein sscle_10g078630 [Sclerotinia sclerotiorum 1980 UF-70]
MSLSAPTKPNALSRIPDDERSPLIPTPDSDDIDSTCSLPSSPSSLSSSTPSPSLTTLILYFMTFHFLIAFCELVLVAPLISLFESSLCQSYYNFPETATTILQHDMRLELCKIPEIQGPLATIRGWKSFGDTVPVLLVAIPVGNMGDRAALMWAMASSLIPENKRSYAFYYIFSAFYIAELVGSYLASITIDISPWIACIPFTQSSPQPRSPSPPTFPSSTTPRPQSTDHTPSSTILTTINHALTQPNVLLCIPVFLVGTLRYTTLNLLIQYSSVRFNTKISQGAMFYTETAVINIFLFLFLLPRVTAFIQSKNSVRTEKIDLALMRISVSFLLLGSLAIGLAPTSGWIPVGVSIFAAGFGSRISTLSLISHFIPASSLATLYASIAVLENIGHAINDPSMQHIFAATLHLPSFWHALPFFVAAICYFLAVISTIFINIDTDELKTRDNGVEE